MFIMQGCGHTLNSSFVPTERTDCAQCVVGGALNMLLLPVRFLMWGELVEGHEYYMLCGTPEEQEKFDAALARYESAISLNRRDYGVCARFCGHAECAPCRAMTAD